MGVSVRVSRNVRMYLPFWIAIPAYLLILGGWIVFGIVYGIFWLAAAGVRALSRGEPR